MLAAAPCAIPAPQYHNPLAYPPDLISQHVLKPLASGNFSNRSSHSKVGCCITRVARGSADDVRVQELAIRRKIAIKLQSGRAGPEKPKKISKYTRKVGLCAFKNAGGAASFRNLGGETQAAVAARLGAGCAVHSMRVHREVWIAGHRDRFTSAAYKQQSATQDRIVAVRQAGQAAAVVEITGIYEMEIVTPARLGDRAACTASRVFICGSGWPEWPAVPAAGGGDLWLVNCAAANPPVVVVEPAREIQLCHLAVNRHMEPFPGGIAAVVDVDSRPQLHHSRSTADIESDIESAFERLLGDNAPGLFRFAEFI